MEYQNRVGKAQSDAQRILDAGSEQLDRERRDMLDGVRSEVASLAILAAEHLSAGTHDYKEDQALLESFLAEVGDVS